LIPGQPVQPGQQFQSGQPFQPGQPGQPYSPFPQANPRFNPAAGYQPAGTQTPAQPNQALGLIQQILTTPRQPPASVSGLTGGGSGIAGVASNADGQGIHIIGDRSKYKEWEFIYDLKNDKSALGQQQQLQQLQQQQLLQQNPQQPAPVRPTR
jgi:hypothetical protein